MAQITPLARRQDLHIITQTLTYPYTTFTTHVTLGTLPAQTDAPSAPSSHDDNNLTNAQIGAIVGSVLGVFLAVLFFIFCCLRRRRMVQVVPVPKSYRSSYSSYESRRDSYVEPEPPIPYFPEVVEPPRPYFQESLRRERHRRSRHRRESFAQPATGEYTRPVPDPYAPAPSYAPFPTELIPGAPKKPTYRAIPIAKPNPTRKF